MNNQLYKKGNKYVSFSEEEECYMIISHEGSVLEVAHDDKTNDSYVWLGDNKRELWQQWKFVRQGKNIYKIINLYSGKCIAVKNEYKNNQNWLIQEKDDGSEEQLWEIKRNNDGSVIICGYTGRKAIDIVGGKKCKNKPVQVKSVFDTVNQYFTLIKVPSSQMLLREKSENAFNKLRRIIEDMDDGYRKEHLEQLSEIQNQYYNPEFKLAIIGNFSSGKSTFLNALLGKELLSVSNLPTTAIPTYIRWNKSQLLHKYGFREKKQDEENPVIKVIMTEGQEQILYGEGSIRKFQKDTGILIPDNIGNLLDYITTTSALIGKIKKIELSFPERKDFENICLIDTPGINPGDEESKEHIVQTQIVLKEEADAAIILYTAQNAMSRNTKEFMENNAAHLMKDAIVVLTQMDTVREREIDKVVKYTERLTKEQFHQEKSYVFYMSAGEALEFKLGRNENAGKWAAQFDQTISDIMSLMKIKRNEITSLRISNLMTDLMNRLSVAFEEERERLTKEEAILEQASIAKLEIEFSSIYKNYLLEIDNAFIEESDKIEKIINQRTQFCCDQICDTISSATNKQKLNWCLNEYFPKTMNEIHEKTVKEVNNTITLKVNEVNGRYVKNVEKCLTKYNRYLGKINSHFADMGFEITASTTLSNNSAASSSLAKALLITGELVYLLNGFNLLILAGVFLFNKVMFESKKNEAKNDVRQKINSYKNNLIQSCGQSLQKLKEENKDWAKNLLSNYKKEYQTAFSQAGQAYIQHKNEIESKLMDNETNRNTLNSLRKEFSSILE